MSFFEKFFGKAKLKPDARQRPDDAQPHQTRSVETVPQIGVARCDRTGNGSKDAVECIPSTAPNSERRIATLIPTSTLSPIAVAKSFLHSKEFVCDQTLCSLQKFMVQLFTDCREFSAASTSKGKRLIQHLMEHQVGVRDRIQDLRPTSTQRGASHCDPNAIVEQDDGRYMKEVLEFAGPLLCNSAQVANDKDLRWLLVFDAMVLTAAVEHGAKRIANVLNPSGTALHGKAARPLADRERSRDEEMCDVGLQLDCFLRFSDESRLFRSVAALLGGVVFREADRVRHVHAHGDAACGHRNGCICGTPDGRAMLDLHLRSTSQMIVFDAFKYVFLSAKQPLSVFSVNVANDWFAATLNTRLIPLALQQWIEGNLQCSRHMHVLSVLRREVFAAFGESTAFDGLVVASFRRLLRHFVIGAKGCRSTAELGAVATKLEAMFLSPSIQWMPLTLLRSMRKVVFEQVSQPLREVTGLQLPEAIARGDSELLRSVCSIEEFGLDFNEKFSSNSWIIERYRCGAASSLRAAVVNWTGVSTADVSSDARWALRAIEGKKPMEAAEMYNSVFRGLLEWLQHHKTLLFLCLRQRGDDERPAEETSDNCFVRALKDGGSSVFASATSFLAYTIHHGMLNLGNGDASISVEDACDVLRLVFPWTSTQHDVFVNVLCHLLEIRILSAAVPILPSFLENERSFYMCLRALQGGSGDPDAKRMDDMIFDAEQQPKLAELFAADRRFAATMDEAFPSRKFDVVPTILRTNVWPSIVTVPYLRTLPIEVKVAMALASDCYRRQWPNRKLEWSHQCCSCSVDVRYANFGKKANRVEVTLPLVGASILSYFDLVCSDVVRIDEVMHAVVVSNAPSSSVVPAPPRRSQFELVLERLVQSKVLLMLDNDENVTSEMNSACLIAANKSFVSKARKINMIPKHRSADNAVKPADAEAKARRDILLKAAIVRVMKSRRELSHEELFGLVVQQLRSQFLPSMAHFKTILAELIETEYLKRKDSDNKSYEYLA